MIIIDGHYFDGQRPIGLKAKITFKNEEISLLLENTEEPLLIKNLKISPRVGSADRFISLDNGAQFACADHPYFDSLPQVMFSEGPVAWLEERWYIALISIAIILSALLVGYFFALPVAAEQIVAQIPKNTEHTLGKEALSWLDKRGWLKPTNLDMKQTQTIDNGFKKLTMNLRWKEYYRLEYRSSKLFGPNAFALPGGIIVITDDMVKSAYNVEEVLAVLAHEIGHVELRHAMKSVLQNSVVAATTATLTSDAASLSAAVSGLPTILVQTKYSREFETAADEYAFQLLKKNNYSPKSFASIMERLSDKYDKDDSTFSYISTHPATAERVQRARNAAIN